MGFSVSKPTKVPETLYFLAIKQKLPQMTGRTVAVTGCTSGMGLIFARTCGQQGARLFLLNRDSPRAEAVVKRLHEEGITEVEHVPCDLGDFDSVRNAVNVLKEKCAESGIDVLCNNAGVMGLPDIATKDGFDVQMQTNHLGHFLLTAGVLSLLNKAADAHGEARVVNHSSGARKKPNWAMDANYLRPNGGNLGGNFNPLAKWTRYQQSKLANVLFTYGLHERLQASHSKVKAVVAHPGATLTDLQLKTAQTGQTGLLDSFILNIAMKSAMSEEDGASGIVWGGCLPDVVSGSFFGPEGVRGPAVLLPPERNREAEEMVWEESVKATGAQYEF